MYYFYIALFVGTVLVPVNGFLMVVAVYEGDTVRYALLEPEIFDGEYWKFQMKSSQTVIDGEVGPILSHCSNWIYTKNTKCYLRFRHLNVAETTPLSNGAHEMTTQGEIQGVQDEGSEGQGVLHMVIKVNNGISIVNGSKRFNGFTTLHSDYLATVVVLVIDKSRETELANMFENTISPLMQLEEGKEAKINRDVLVESIALYSRSFEEKLSFLFFKCWNVREMAGKDYIVGSTVKCYQSTLIVSDCHVKLLFPTTTMYALGMITFNNEKGSIWIKCLSDDKGNMLHTVNEENPAELVQPEWSISKLIPQLDTSNASEVESDTLWATIRVKEPIFDPLTKKITGDFDFGEWVFLCFWNGEELINTMAYQNTKIQVFTLFDEFANPYFEAVFRGLDPDKFKVKISEDRESCKKDEVSCKGFSIKRKNYDMSPYDNVIKRRFVQLHYYNPTLNTLGKLFSYIGLF